MGSGFFIDVTCPKCGRAIGCGGNGNTFRCECGYAGNGGPRRKDVELIQKFYQCAAARGREVQDR